MHAPNTAVDTAPPPRPHPVFDVADRYADAVAACSPLEATRVGIAGHDDRWGDFGPDGVEARTDLWRRTRRELDALPTPADRWSRLAERVLREELDGHLEDAAHGEPYLDIAHVGSTIPTLRRVLELQGTDDDSSRAAVLRRLATIDEALAGWRDRVDVGRKGPSPVAARQVRSISRQLDELASDRGAFARVAAELTVGDPDLETDVTAALAKAQAAAATTARWLERTYLPDASDRDAVGPERYERLASRLLGVQRLDPHEAYAWGWERIGELRARAVRTARRIDPSGNVLEAMEALRRDRAHVAPTPDAFRELMQARQLDALERLHEVHFDVPQGIRAIDVRLATGGALGAFYVGPSEDGRRPGTVWWNFGGAQRIPIFDEVSTNYHEGFPGHHLQLGTAVLLTEQLTRAHRLLIWNPGYGEGWALYAEQLMDELGFVAEPPDQLGYLSGELLRAVRVVVDIGLHLELRIPQDAPVHAGRRWDAERAVDALTRIASLSRPKAGSEVTRYLGWPGQAVTYALGQREIVALRDARQRRDGARFDPRRFHAEVLGNGSVGLDHLRELILGTEDGPAAEA